MKGVPNAYIMLQELVSSFDGCQPVELLMVNANQADPLLAPVQKRLLQTLGISMEPQRVRVERVDLHGAAHRAEINDSLHLTHHNTMRERPIDEINALQCQLIHGLALDRSADPRSELKQPRKAGNRALGDHEASWYEDGVEEVEGDLPMRGQTVDRAQSDAVVGGDSGVEDVDRKEHIVLLLGATLLGL